MILAVVGPTGVGKTKLSVELAKRYNGIVVNCDAVQVYKELNIGSAKATEEEMRGIKHYLIDIVSPDEYYSVKNYQDDLRNILDNNKDKNIIIVGGTGLYLTAGIYDYRFNEDINDDDYDDYSNEELYNMAKDKDKNMNIDKNNRVRLIRFLKKDNSSLVDAKPFYNVLVIGLTTNRDNLYSIINNRVDNMINNGLVDEVRKLYNKYPNSRVLKSAIGYKEIIDYFDNLVPLDKAIDNIKTNSRHYAKRQYTWFNNKLDVKWFNVDYNNFSNTIDEVINYIERNNNE